jgi:predicted Fe-Mo cluster-binding NifX family protein
MSAIAFMTLFDGDDSALSLHFGKAKWLAIVEADSKRARFVQNTALNGRSVVSLLVANHCADVVFNEIGSGALQHLRTANIQGWFGPGDTPIPHLLEMFRQGKLQRAIEPREGHIGHGCGQQDAHRCCGKTTG